MVLKILYFCCMLGFTIDFVWFFFNVNFKYWFYIVTVNLNT